MPGPVSDSYDPEFGTGENASIVCEAVTEMRDLVSKALNDAPLLNIVEVCQSASTPRLLELRLDEREMRILRFALNRALESL